MTKAVFGGFQLETVQVFFAILAARSALIAMESDQPADAFVAGLCAGCGAMFKPTGLAVLVPLAVGLIVVNWRRRRFARICAHLAATGVGVAIPLAVALIYLVGADLLHDMPSLWRQISTYASETAWATEDLIKPLVAACLIGFPMLVRGWICRRQRDGTATSARAYVRAFAIAWLIAEAIGIVMQRRMYAYHFLPIIPPAALLFGIIPRTARPALSRRRCCRWPSSAFTLLPVLPECRLTAVIPATIDWRRQPISTPTRIPVTPSGPTVGRG